MTLGSISRYAVQSVFRNRRRTFAAIIGALLAVTLVAGENIAIDTTASSVFNQMLSELAFDFEGHSTTNIEPLDAAQAISAVRHVEAVEPVVSILGIEVTEWGSNGSDYDIFASVYAISSTFHTVSDKFGLETDPTVSSGQIAVTDDLATGLNVSAGDQLTFRFRVYNGSEPTFYYHNVTIGRIVILERISEEVYGIPSTPFQFMFSIFLSLDDLNLIITSLGLDEDVSIPLLSSYYIWVDREAVVKPGDPAKTEELLTRMQRDLNSAGSQYGIFFQESPLTSAVQFFSMWILMYRAIFLALTIPAIVLGLYLGIIGAELGLGERRREIGILKARGAKDRQIFGLLIVEAIILGLIAGTLGIIFGTLTSNLFQVLSPFGLRQSILEITVTESTVILAIVLAIVLLLISTYRPAKRMSGLSVTETLHKYSAEEAAVHYKPTRDLLFIGLAVFTYASLLFLRSSAEGGFSTISVFCFLLPIVIVLTPFSPFFLIIGLTSFLTRASTKIYDWTSRISKVFTKELYVIVNKNIVRNPKRASSVCVLIAMGLAFGVIVSSMSETQSAFLERSLNAQIGGDIALQAWPVNRSFRTQIEDMEGVKEVADATLLGGEFGYEHLSVSVWAIDSSTYWSVVHPDSYYFKEGDPKSTISELRTKGNVIINELFASNQYLRVNDRIMVTVTSQYQTPDGNWSFEETEYDFLIVGIVKTLPGYMVSEIGIWTEGEVYVDYLSLNETAFGNQSVRFIVDVEGGGNPADVKQTIIDTSPESVEASEIRVYEEELEEARSDPIAGALFNFLLIEFLFALLIIGVGLGLIMYVAATEREGEFASIMSRGASRKQVAGLLMGEAVTIIIIGVTIGIATGLITSFVFNELIGFGIQMDVQGTLDMPLVVSYQTVGLIVATIVILIAASLLASIKIRRMDLVAALRKRGG